MSRWLGTVLSGPGWPSDIVIMVDWNSQPLNRFCGFDQPNFTWDTLLDAAWLVGPSDIGWIKLNKQYLQNYVKILNHNRSLWLNWVDIEPCRLFMVHLLLYNIDTYQHLQNCWIWTWLGLRFSFIILDFAQRWRLKSGYDPEHDLPHYQAVQRQNVAQLDTRFGPDGNHMANCQNWDCFFVGLV